MIDTSLVVNFDVMSIKNENPNDKQNEHQNLEAVNPIAVTHDLKPLDNRRVQPQCFPDVAVSSR
jgi:hypothetical protein